MANNALVFANLRKLYNPRNSVTHAENFGETHVQHAHLQPLGNTSQFALQKAVIRVAIYGFSQCRLP